jgi:hypothetical protein
VTAHPIRVAVLAHDGALLGYVTRRPTNGNWRNLGALPRIILRKGTEFPSTRECNGLDGEWWVKLYEGETPPANLAPPESVG